MNHCVWVGRRLTSLSFSPEKCLLSLTAPKPSLGTSSALSCFQRSFSCSLSHLFLWASSRLPSALPGARRLSHVCRLADVKWQRKIARTLTQINIWQQLTFLASHLFPTGSRFVCRITPATYYCNLFQSMTAPLPNIFYRINSEIEISNLISWINNMYVNSVDQ